MMTDTKLNITVEELADLLGDHFGNNEPKFHRERLVPIARRMLAADALVWACKVAKGTISTATETTTNYLSDAMQRRMFATYRTLYAALALADGTLDQPQTS